MVGRFGQAELCILMDIGEQTDPTGRSDYKVQKAFDGIEIGYDGRDFRFQEMTNLLGCVFRLLTIYF